MDVIDLRSDTVTKPDAGDAAGHGRGRGGGRRLRRGPDRHAAGRGGARRPLGMEAALFVPSGTHGQPDRPPSPRPAAAARCSARPRATSVNYEMGAMAAISAAAPPRRSPSHQGLLDPAAVEAAIAPDDVLPRPHRLIESRTRTTWPAARVYDRPRAGGDPRRRPPPRPAGPPRRRPDLQRRRGAGRLPPPSLAPASIR